MRLLILLLFTVTIYSQEKTKSDFSNEIDTQVWQPFIKAYKDFDSQAYNGLHADDALRITKDGIKQGKVFKDEITNYFTQSKGRLEQEIAFKFEHRVHTPSIAYEVGYYKIIITVNKQVQTFYGRFNVVLRKIKGQWKITQDWDTNSINGHQVTQEDFDKL